MIKALSLLCLIFLSGRTFGQFQQSGFMQELLFRMQLQQEMGQKVRKEKPFDEKVDCLKAFESLKTEWKNQVVSKKRNLLREGTMPYAFTLEEIEKMKFTHHHGLLGKVRGQDQYHPGGFSHSGSPPFPHTRPGCAMVFEEEVKIKEFQGKKCRQVKFGLSDHRETVYFQLYCQDSTDLWINFDPENKFAPEELQSPSKDCPHCAG